VPDSFRWRVREPLLSWNRLARTDVATYRSANCWTSAAGNSFEKPFRCSAVVCRMPRATRPRRLPDKQENNRKEFGAVIGFTPKRAFRHQGRIRAISGSGTRKGTRSPAVSQSRSWGRKSIDTALFRHLIRTCYRRPLCKVSPMAATKSFLLFSCLSGSAYYLDSRRQPTWRAASGIGQTG
jgi:hypothetical protein